MIDLLGSDPTAFVASVLATVAASLTSLVVLLIYFWVLSDIAAELPPVSSKRFGRRRNRKEIVSERKPGSGPTSAHISDREA
jgi:hypothetical protein